MALSASLKTTVDAVFDDVVSQLASIQTTYKNANGKYWQGIVCTATIPADGNLVSSDLTVKPTDQNETWEDINGASNGITLDATIPLSLSVTSYSGSNGHGYVLIGRVEEDAKLYGRAVNVGSETRREHSWVDITPEI